MKKFVSAVAVLALVAFAAPALAATNPFMDVPMNHWAYDAIGQLAAHGILSGYPDGTYKGKQPTTRYEMASALARALAVVDMTKASRQDVEMLQKLVVEFHDELEALGVTVADLEGKVNLLDKRLGGWQLSGALRLDVVNNNKDANEAAGEPDTSFTLSRARVWFDKYWGEDDQFHFRGRINNANAHAWDRFYVEMPFFFDTKFTVGRNAYNLESGYYIDSGNLFVSEVAGGLGAHLTDRAVDGFALQKQFGLGSFTAYLAHPTLGRYSVWELAMAANLQFTEAFGFDIGGQYFAGDNSLPANGTWTTGDITLDKMWTIFAGLHYNFTESIAFKGIYYHQKYDGDVYDVLGDGAWYSLDNTVANGGWDLDNSSNWKVLLDVSQDALKFTSLWLEYGQAKRGFVMPNGNFFWQDNDEVNLAHGMFLDDDVKYFRVAARQIWNDKWTTALFYNGFDWDHDYTENTKNVWGLGIEYAYTPTIHFGLAYISASYEDGWDAVNNVATSVDDDHIIRFRTQVTF